MTPRSPRDELIRIQKRLVARIKREIRDSLGPEDPQIARYYNRYQKALRRFELSGKPTLVEAVVQADLVYNGDYHTLRQSQKIPIRILTEVVQARPAIVLCLEMVMAEHQPALDRFMAGELEEGPFLDAIDYENSWGFEWSHYRVLFDFAREHRLPVVAINHRPAKRRNSLLSRDRQAAEIIARQTLDRPDALIYVIDGDLHIAPEHLPAEVDKLLADAGAERTSLIVYQNAERIYWQLAREGQEQVDVVRLGPEAFCVMNSTPLAKFQSYLNWVQNREELPQTDRAEWAVGDAATFTEQVADLVRTVAAFLQIERDDLDAFTVYTTRDLNFLDRLRDSGDYTAHEIEQIRSQIQREESYFITRSNIIYLANLSINHAAEEATHFIHHQCAGSASEPLLLKTDFYYRTLHEALGFLGSKIINHKRTCYKEKDFEDFLSENRRRRLGPKLQEVRQICRFAVQHKQMERAAFQTQAPNRLRAVYQLPTGLHLGVTHALGYMLGDKMYYALIDGEVEKEEVRSLFHERFDDAKRAYATYMDLAERMEAIHERCYAKDVCL